MQTFGSESERAVCSIPNLLGSETSSCDRRKMWHRSDDGRGTRCLLQRDLNPTTRTKDPNSKPPARSGRSVPGAVLHDRFLTPGPTRIELKECNKFHDADGKVLFRLCAKTVTVSGRIVVKDAGGTHVGHVRRKRTPGPRATYYIGNKKKDKIVTLKAKAMKTKTCPSKCDTEIYLGDSLIGETVGNWFVKSFNIYVAGIRVAKASRGPGCAEGGFYIDVKTAVDTSLVVMVVLALGQIYEWTDSYNGGVCSNILSGCSFNNSETTISTNTSSGDAMDDKLFMT